METSICGQFLRLKTTKHQEQVQELRKKQLKQFEQDIDIRSVVRNMIDTRILLKRFLTKTQRVLFQLQRSRAIELDQDGLGSFSDEKACFLMGKKQLKQAETELEGFEVKKNLDKLLLLGVLKREVK